MLAVFSVGYVEMSRRVTRAGGFYSFVSHGLRAGRVGLGTAAVVTARLRDPRRPRSSACSRYFAAHDDRGLDRRRRSRSGSLLFGALAVNVAFPWFDVRITARVLGVFFVAEVLARCSCSRSSCSSQGGDRA